MLHEARIYMNKVIKRSVALVLICFDPTGGRRQRDFMWFFEW
jgi:hypothetical protein